MVMEIQVVQMKGPALSQGKVITKERSYID